jgi:hypothetical protein
MINSEQRTTSNNFVHLNFCIGKPGHQIPVCKKIWAKAHKRGKSCVNQIIKECKENVVSTQKTLNVRTVITKEIANSLVGVCKTHGFQLSNSDKANMRIVDDSDTLHCAAWMKNHFSMCGDCIPNRNDEFHLEPVDKAEIYLEYKRDQVQQSPPQPYISLTKFYSLWNDCFQNVKIRQFKACGGKCNICADLSEARRKEVSLAGRAELTQLHALHRCTYMGERRCYYENRLLAVSQPQAYLSCIEDGMAQCHNEIPYRANLAPFQNKLSCHLLGIINHGRQFSLYRTFSNISPDSNLAIHVWLSELQEVIDREGRLPDTIFHQIDGGSENANRAHLAIAELLVAKRLCRKVVLTRLPPGHTHEDIDSKFGVIWKRCRNDHIRSPQEAAEMICGAFKKTSDSLGVKVVDVFAVPDYWNYITKFVDPKLGRAWKEEWTQLQWSFEAVDM